MSNRVRKMKIVISIAMMLMLFLNANAELEPVEQPPEIIEILIHNHVNASFHCYTKMNEIFARKLPNPYIMGLPNVHAVEKLKGTTHQVYIYRNLMDNLTSSEAENCKEGRACPELPEKGTMSFSFKGVFVGHQSYFKYYSTLPYI